MTLHTESVSAIRAIQSGTFPGRRVVFVSGTFNIVHPGHLRLLRFAAECGDYLVVGVLGDRLSENAQIGEEMRREGVAAISWVGHAFLLRDSPESFIAELRPAVVVKGKEHENGNNPEIAAGQAFRGKTLFGSRGTTNFSLQP